MEVIDKVDVRDEIMGWMKANRRSFAWLQWKTGLPYHVLYSIIKLKTVKITDERLTILNEAMGTEFKK